MSTSSIFPELLLEQEDGSEFSGFEADSSNDSSKPRAGEDEQGSQGATEDTATAQKRYASQETVQVRRVRILLLGVICLGVAVSLATYFFVNSEAENDYTISVSLV